MISIYEKMYYRLGVAEKDFFSRRVRKAGEPPGRFAAIPLNGD